MGLSGEMGIRGRDTAFLKAVYSDVSCEVKVGEKCSEPFGVSCGLRQGCILSPLLFLLYVNSLVYKLKEAEVGMKCGFLGGRRFVGLWRMKGREIDAVCWRSSLSAPVP